MVLDVHAHYIPPSVFRELADNPGKYPGVELLPAGDGKYRLKIGDAPPTRPVMPLLYDLDKRRQWMKEQRIDYQFNGGWLDMFGYDLPPEAGERWSRMLNEHLAAAVARESSWLGGLATVPLQDGEAAARETRRARGLGLKGILIGTFIAGKDLDDRSLDPFWAAAAEEGLPVMIHPVYAGENPRLNKYGLPNIVDRAYETVLAAANLIYGGVLERNPGLKIILCHGGGYLPYQVGRLDRGFAVDAAAAAKGGKAPSELARELWYDHVVFHPLALRYLVDLVGAERVLLGSDYPFPIGDLSPLQVMEATRFTAAERALIQEQSARRLFQLS